MSPIQTGLYQNERDVPTTRQCRQRTDLEDVAPLLPRFRWRSLHVDMTRDVAYPPTYLDDAVVVRLVNHCMHVYRSEVIESVVVAQTYLTGSTVLPFQSPYRRLLAVSCPSHHRRRVLRSGVSLASCP